MDEKTNAPIGSKRNLVLIGLGMAILALTPIVWVASQYENKPLEKTPITSKQTQATKPSSPNKAPTKTKVPSKAKSKATVIGPGESAEVQCGKGSDGINPQLDSSSSNLGYTQAGGSQRHMTVYVLDKNWQRAKGARLKWAFGSWGFGGSLAIEGCSAIFTPPTSMGSSGYSSADIYVSIVSPTSLSKPQSSGTGEGGPVFAGYSLKKSILVYSDNGTSTSCYDPAGVAISINSVSTYSNVQIVVDTPRFTGRTYNGRITTVRDGPGTYEIDFFVDGSLYDSTTSQVAQCQLATVKR